MNYSVHYPRRIEKMVLLMVTPNLIQGLMNQGTTNIL
jgi:hypothetical protein